MKKITCLLFLFAAITQTAQTRKGEFRLSSATAVHDLYVSFEPGLSFNSSESIENQVATGIPGIESLLEDYGFTLQKGISFSEEKFKDMARRAKAISGDDIAVRRLQNIFRVSIPNSSNARLVELASALEKLDLVTYCSLVSKEAIAPPNDIAPVTPNFQTQQTYINPDPGVNMQYAWDLGLAGSDIKIRDVEYGFNKQHEEFVDNDNVFLAPDMTISSDATASYIDHGTAVLGVIYGDVAGYGVTGMANEAAELILFPEWQETGYNRILAVTNSIANSVAGDVIIYEMQTGGSTNTAYVPAEYENVIWDLTKAATDSGIVVVAAAGNGNQNLDALFYAPYLARGNSGAIIVGGGTADLAHNKISYSTYGTRVDVQGWASNVLTSGYGNTFLFGSDYNQGYTLFSGTSSATPIVASCVVVLQSYYFAQADEYLTGVEIRNILQETGIPQGTGGNIGPLPNMESALLVLDGLLAVKNRDKLSFGIFPNPATSSITIHGNVGQAATVQFINSVGQLVYSKQLPENREMDISQLSAGFYFVQVTDGAYTSVRKIIKR